MTMQRLTEIIGPAPSELSPDEHIAILTFERNRVRSALQAFRTGFDPKGYKKKKGPAKKTKPKKEPPNPIIAQLKAAGLSEDKILTLLKAMNEKENPDAAK